MKWFVLDRSLLRALWAVEQRRTKDTDVPEMSRRRRQQLRAGVGKPGRAGPCRWWPRQPGVYETSDRGELCRVW